MRTKLMWLAGIAGSTLRSILVPTATERRRSTVLPPQAKPRRYGRVAPMLVPVVVPLALGGLWLAADPAESTRLRLRSQFQRPSSLPSPATNVLSSARIELGRRLFNETRLSADNSISCLTCHNPAQGAARPEIQQGCFARAAADAHACGATIRMRLGRQSG